MEPDRAEILFIDLSATWKIIETVVDAVEKLKQMSILITYKLDNIAVDISFEPLNFSNTKFLMSLTKLVKVFLDLALFSQVLILALDGKLSRANHFNNFTKGLKKKN